MGWGSGMTQLIFMILVISLAAVFISRMFPQQKKNMDSTDSLSILKMRLRYKRVPRGAAAINREPTAPTDTAPTASG